MPAGPIQANAYFLVSEDQSCLIFDPGGEADKINNYIKENNLKPLAILLTHAHFDHIGALDEVRDRWDVPVYLHKNEEKWLEDSSLNGSGILRGIAVTARPAERLIEGDGILAKMPSPSISRSAGRAVTAMPRNMPDPFKEESSSHFSSFL